MFSLRPFQREALERLKKPVHLVCIAPTGSGKSLIYERAAAQPGRKTLLISPLIALARQQAERLREQGLTVVLHPGTSPKPEPPVGSGVWIISPESLQSKKQLDAIRRWAPEFLVVDECHCLYDWGENFRKSFLQIPDLINAEKIPRSLWLTATLPQDARTDLESRLQTRLEVMGKFSLSPNLKLRVSRIPALHRPQALAQELRNRKDAGLIFVSTREMTARLQALLRANGREASTYHAGLSQEERCAVELRFRRSENEVLISTSAFGMGMDYPNLRWTLLWQPPASLLALAQALGRVGRRPEVSAHASLFWDEEDFQMLRWLYGRSPRGSNALQQIFLYIKEAGCRTSRLEAFFNTDGHSEPHSGCGHCDFCAPTAF